MNCSRKWNISIQYDMMTMNPLSQAETLVLSAFSNNKLRRLPHVFSRILQLPLRSDADVAVEESPNCFRFMAVTDSSLGHVETHALHIHPGVTRIVVRASQSLHFSLDDLHPDIWRFRLPESVIPELTTAVVVDGMLVVTVPKADRDDENNTAAVGGGGASLVVVQ
ncbi:uncharacterized protein LOC127076803 [Lathyrus oleraceus]|uniref:SHSP domain-containing protein n=1 Tax=Pisum sativum TaxID=3888 RepID=A0A9D4XLT0_PEA|nr:uncharacterized protein LOC127076803 [Pisum sativum]KAI5423461.1 hypothetical protein KIW84_046425 [Pisum sativum]